MRSCMPDFRQQCCAVQLSGSISMYPGGGGGGSTKTLAKILLARKVNTHLINTLLFFS